MLAQKECLQATYPSSNYIKNYKSVSFEDNILTIFFEVGKIQITYFPQDVIKVFVGETFEESTPVAVDDQAHSVPIEYEQTSEFIIAKGIAIDTYIAKSDLKISFKTKDGTIVCQDYKPASKEGKNIFVSKTNDCIAYYGFGEKGGALNKKYTYMENYNTDDASNDDNTVLFYKTIPFYIALGDKKSYGIYFDNSYRSFFDMGRENKERIFFGANGGKVQYYFIPGASMKEVVSSFTNLTGRMDLPPMWSLGYQQCRYSYGTREEVETLANTFRKKNIPCDTIYLDIDYMEDYKVMTFDPVKFPNPEEMLKDLTSQGFKIVTIIDPGVKVQEGYSIYEKGSSKNHFVTTSDGHTYKGEVWPGESVFPDFSNHKAREWWKDELKLFLSLGVKGIWNDMNEPAVFDNISKTMPESCLHNSDKGIMEHKEFHNLYGMEMSRCAKEALIELNPQERPFSMTRATFAGGQKYSSVWTGDNQSTWNHLRMSIPMNCNLGLSGLSFVGNDVGGFGGDCDEELFIRWMQLGTFLPIFRNHSAVNTRRQEPWSFGHQTESIVKKAIELRYRLLPYIYNCYYTSSTQGLPVMRPMVMEYENDPNTLDLDTQFMLGNSMLIAPVLHENERSKVVYLPKGIWFNYFTHEKFEGGKYYNISVNLDDVPVFVKEGSIIPVYDCHLNYIGEKSLSVTLEVFKGKGSFIYYEDDGHSNDYRQGSFNLYNIISENEGQTQKVSFDLLINGYEPPAVFQVKYI